MDVDAQAAIETVEAGILSMLSKVLVRPDAAELAEKFIRGELVLRFDKFGCTIFAGTPQDAPQPDVSPPRTGQYV